MVKPVGLTKKFRGLHPQKVDQYLQDLEESQKQEIESLRKQVEDYREEKNLLQKRLNELQEERAKKAVTREELEFALLRAKETVEILRQKAEAEIEEIAKKAERDNQYNKDKIKSFEKEIEETKSHMQSLLDSIINIYQEPEIATEAAKQLSRKVIQFDEKMNDKKITQDKLIERDEEKRLYQEEEQRITADGTGITDLPKTSIKPEQTQQFKKMLDNLAKVLNVPKDEQELIIADKDEKSQEVAACGFWDNENNTDVKIAPAKEKPTGANKENNSFYSDEPTHETPKINENEITNEEFNEVKEKTPEKDNVESTVANKADAFRQEDLGSPTVAAEINSIRHKYIAGKVAGQDLFDKDGSLIIAKGETITSEVLAKAEIEGKLPELIVNMVLPGMEE